MLLGNADAIVQHLCLKLGWDLPLDPRQKDTLAQSAQAQAILGKRPSSSTDLTNEPEKVVSPTRVGDRYVPPGLRVCVTLTVAVSQSCMVVRRCGRWEVVERVRENSPTRTRRTEFAESSDFGRR